MTKLWVVSALVTMASCTLVLAVGSTDVMDLHGHWNSFKARYNKQYESAAEEQMRFAMFAKNKLKIDQFNAHESGKAGFTQGINHFSDWTEQELRTVHAYKSNLMRHQLAGAFGGESSGPDADEFLERLLADDEPLPDAVDWRKRGRVGSVRDGGLCESSFSVAAAGLLEGQEKQVLSNGSQLIDLSIQQLLDCGSIECSGGDLLHGLNLTIRAGGVMSDKDYPYEGAKGAQCNFDKSKTVISPKGYKTLTPYDELLLQKVVAKYGPVAVSIDALYETFRNYKGGVYEDANCGFGVNLNVLVVGYVTNDMETEDYWIIKNSFGTDWGEAGYMNMIMHKNMCMIAWRPVIATF